MDFKPTVLGSLMLVAVNVVNADDGQKIYTQGGALPAATACFACHGADGMGMPAAGFPRLAGLSAGYLSKQLADFRSGSRVSPVMQPLAKALSESEIQAVTSTLAAMPAPTVVIAAGADAAGGGLIGGGYTGGTGVGDVVPVDVWVPGAPASPFSLLHAILLALGRVHPEGAAR